MKLFTANSYTVEDLKKEYRLLSRRYHPDLGGSKEIFQQLQTEYEKLQKICVLPSSTYHEVRTVDGRLLTDLGNGLGPTVNGKPCYQCKEVGYTSYHHVGRYTKCKNAIVIYHDIFGIIGVCSPSCRECHGEGRIKEKGKVFYHTCFTCNGTGEVVIFNPVIPKGRLAGKRL